MLKRRKLRNSLDRNVIVCYNSRRPKEAGTIHLLDILASMKKIRTLKNTLIVF